MIADENLPLITKLWPIHVQHSDFITKPIQRRAKLPGVRAIGHVSNNTGKSATDYEVMQWLLKIAKKHPHLVWLLFTRDIHFCESACVKSKDLKKTNVRVVVLQNFVDYLRSKRIFYSHKNIGHLKEDKLKELMQIIYVLWYRYLQLKY